MLLCTLLTPLTLSACPRCCFCGTKALGGIERVCSINSHTDASPLAPVQYRMLVLREPA
jgi:hypothetical protein